MNNTNYAKEKDLPKFITVTAHDGEGNGHYVKYISEKAIDGFILRLQDAINELDEYSLIGEEGDKE